MNTQKPTLPVRKIAQLADVSTKAIYGIGDISNDAILEWAINRRKKALKIAADSQRVINALVGAGGNGGGEMET
jgi:hypothetical protein